MTASKTSHDIILLREEIKKHNIAYYDNDSPLISDAEYDKLVQQLKNLESQEAQTDLFSVSPLETIGGHVSEKFNKMLSYVLRTLEPGIITSSRKFHQ